jgi:hypothetical protein
VVFGPTLVNAADNKEKKSMSKNLSFHRARGRKSRFWFLATVLVLLLGLTTAIAPAQEETGRDTYPYAMEDDAADLEPVILSEVRRGDVTTVTIEISPGADTFTASGQPNSNFGSDSLLRIGFNTAGLGAVRTYLFFSVASIPVNATVQDARLRAYVTGFSPSGDSPMGILARFLTSPWDASSITWNNFNPSWGAEIGVADIPAAVGWVEGNATGPVAEWVSGARANNGILLQGDERPDQGRERVLFSVNNTNGLQPRLIVTYDVITDTMPPTATVASLPQWSPATFTVNWSGSDNAGGSGIRNYDVQFRANGGAWQNWQNQTTATSANFTGQNGVLYEFRARARDIANNVGQYPNSPQAATTVDTIAPTATVQSLPQFTFNDQFIVSWTGFDQQPGSGIAAFDVQFQVNGGNWQDFRSNTTDTSGQFTAATRGATYGFRARATDRAGNTQNWSPVAQASTIISTGNPTASIVPFPFAISNTTTFLVQWIGEPVPGTTIVSYDVQFRFNGGAWQSWQNRVAATSLQFTAQRGDGVYEFQVRAYDNIGRVSQWAGPPGNSVAVDVNQPFITPQVFAPALFNQ